MHGLYVWLSPDRRYRRQKSNAVCFVIKTSISVLYHDYWHKSRPMYDFYAIICDILHYYMFLEEKIVLSARFVPKPLVIFNNPCLQGLLKFENVKNTVILELEDLPRYWSGCNKTYRLPSLRVYFILRRGEKAVRRRCGNPFLWYWE